MSSGLLLENMGMVQNFIERQVPALPEDCIPRGSPARAAPRGDVDHESAPSAELPADRPSRAVSLLREGTRKAALVTQ